MTKKIENTGCTIYDGVIIENEEQSETLPKREEMTHRFKVNNKLKDEYEYNQEHKKVPKYEEKKYLGKRSKFQKQKERNKDLEIEKLEQECLTEE